MNRVSDGIYNAILMMKEQRTYFMKQINNKRGFKLLRYANYYSCQRGISLVETVVAFGIASILITLAAPIYTDTLAKSKLESYTQSL
ncbi:MAG: prepilin-type N-terminal cleavage/methylation domain-containing protein, partial [Nitrospinae bacterium]|nr:prepilin-type N-terminal cleavage/methylation domain-containing protein [Nitrospinota bacterium]